MEERPVQPTMNDSVNDDMAKAGSESDVAKDRGGRPILRPYHIDGSDYFGDGASDSDGDDRRDTRALPTETAASTAPSCFVFQDKECSTQANALLWQMRASCELVDVVLRMDDGTELACHRTVLATRSAFFRAKFASDLSAECRQGFVDLRGIRPAAIKRLVRYIYTGVLSLTTASAPCLLSAAAFLQLDAAKNACAEYMENHMDESNCVEAYWLATGHECEGLRRRANRLMERHYATVSRGQAFLTLLPWESVALLVASCELNVDDEAVVLQSVLRWLRHDAPSRQVHADTLLRLVRFKLLDTDTLERLLNDEDDLLRSAKEGLKLMREARKFLKQHDSDRTKKTGRLLRAGMTKPGHCLMLVGGAVRLLLHDPAAFANVYDPCFAQAYTVKSLVNSDISKGPCDVVNCAALVTHDNRLFAAGGSYIFRRVAGHSAIERQEVRSDFFEYDADFDCWRQMEPMRLPRANFAMAEVDRRIYCFGGYTTNYAHTTSIECYNLVENQWEYVTEMPTFLVDFAAVVIDGKVFILGGRNGETAQKTVFKFDPSPTCGGSMWEQLATMPTALFSFAATVAGKEIFVAGGKQVVQHHNVTSMRATNTVEVYNVGTNQWRLAHPLPQPLYNAGLFVINGNLYCFGTTEEQRSEYTLEIVNVIFELKLSHSGGDSASVSTAVTVGGWKRTDSEISHLRGFAVVAYHLRTFGLQEVLQYSSSDDENGFEDDFLDDDDDDNNDHDDYDNHDDGNDHDDDDDD